MKSQTSAPLLETLLNHAQKHVHSFHTPGHKNGQGIDPKLKKFTGKNVYYLDVTVFPEVDSLHDPSGCIKKSHELIAEAYGVEHSFFLVNGSTVGNIAMFLSACNPGDSVILSRNCHKSILAGIILAGVWPIWIQPKVDQNLNIIYDASPNQIEEALNRYPEAKTVFITSPTYNGVTTDLIKIAEIVHRRKKILLVDEAHGPHLKFHKDLPISAVEAGSDLCVQSVHKILGALSQAAVMHFDSDLIDVNRVKRVITMLQTTSPNYFILSSMDGARRQMVLHGERILERLIKNCEYARTEINKMENLSCFTRKEIQSRGYDLDVTKLTINVSKTGLTGYNVADILAKEYNIQVDAADLYNLIAITGIGTTKNDIIALINAVGEINKKNQGKSKNWKLSLPSFDTELVMLPRDVFFISNVKRVALSKAVGNISAQTLTPYPPGIPILIPGERITKEIVDYVYELIDQDIRISGQEAETLKTIKVVSV